MPVIKFCDKGITSKNLEKIIKNQKNPALGRIFCYKRRIKYVIKIGKVGLKMASLYSKEMKVWYY